MTGRAAIQTRKKLSGLFFFRCSSHFSFAVASVCICCRRIAISYPQVFLKNKTVTMVRFTEPFILGRGMPLVRTLGLAWGHEGQHWCSGFLDLDRGVLGCSVKPALAFGPA
jgi:hypothetical protein